MPQAQGQRIVGCKSRVGKWPSFSLWVSLSDEFSSYFTMDKPYFDILLDAIMHSTYVIIVSGVL